MWDDDDAPIFKEDQKSSFRFHRTFGEIPPKKFVVDGFLARGEVSCFFGEPGATKSSLALDIACHVAGGMPWMGRGAGTLLSAGVYRGEHLAEDWCPGNVLYVALERADQVQRRVEAFTDEYDLPKPLSLAIYDGELDFVGDVSDRLTQIVEQALFASADVNHPAGEDEFDQIDLIIIDTLARTFGSGSDSGGEETAKVARHLKRTVKFTGAHILLVHHTPIGDDSRLRGHGNLLAAFDQTVRVQKLKGGSLATVIKDNDSADDQKPCFAYTTKSRVIERNDISGREITAPVVVPVEPSAVKQKLPKLQSATKKVTKPSKSEEPVLAALAGLGRPSTEDEWRAAYDAARGDDISLANHRTRFSRGKPALQAKGLITQEGDLWSITVTE